MPINKEKKLAVQTVSTKDLTPDILKSRILLIIPINKTRAKIKEVTHGELLSARAHNEIKHEGETLKVTKISKNHSGVQIYA